jgi:hypothetical protein
VLGVDGGKVKIASGGMDHEIDIETGNAIEGERVTLTTTAEETVRTWHYAFAAGRPAPKHTAGGVRTS